MPAADPDILDLNLCWLVKARELARHNRQKAAVVLGMDPVLLGLFSRLSLGQLNTLARAGVLLFRPRFRPALWRQFIEGPSPPFLSVRLQTLMQAAGEPLER